MIKEIFAFLTHRHRYTSLRFFLFLLTKFGDDEYSVDMQRQHSVLFDARIYNLHSFEVWCTFHTCVLYKYARYQNANEPFLCEWIPLLRKKNQICWYCKYQKSRPIRQKTPLTPRNNNTRIKHKRPCLKAFLWLLLLCNINPRLQIIIAYCLTNLIMCQW